MRYQDVLSLSLQIHDRRNDTPLLTDKPRLFCGPHALTAVIMSIISSSTSDTAFVKAYTAFTENLRITM